MDGPGYLDAILGLANVAFLIPLWRNGKPWFAGAIGCLWLVFILTPKPISTIAAALAFGLTVFCLRQQYQFNKAKATGRKL